MQPNIIILTACSQHASTRCVTVYSNKANTERKLEKNETENKQNKPTIISFINIKNIMTRDKQD